MEIGSIYEINPTAVKEAIEGIENDNISLQLQEVEKYKKKNIKYTASGREAITLALKSISLKSTSLKSMHRANTGMAKKCLLPAYMCDTVFLPFEWAGWEVHFYHIGKNLEAHEEELRRRMEQIRPSLLFIHCYYGVDTWKQLRSFLKEWQDKGVCIMEDVTQSYYLKDTGMEADYVIGSLRKWYSVPDGGFVASNHTLAVAEDEDNTEFINKRLKFLTDKWEYLYGIERGKKELKASYLERNKEAEERLDEKSGISVVSRISEKLLNKQEETAAKNRRIENCCILFEELQGSRNFTYVWDNLEKDTAPLYFPIYVEDRDSLQEYLREHDIYAPVLWPIGIENISCLTEAEKYIYEHLLAIPVDQRYGREEMHRIVDVMKKYDKEQENKGIIGIRADANETVATGHIMRCITIARQLKKKGESVLFFTADDYAASMLESAGMEAVCLRTQWNKMEEELPALLLELEKAGCTKLLVDSYQATPKYLEELHKNVKVIYMDDMFEHVYSADMIINYNAYHERFPYRESYGADTKLLLGTDYVPLREEFAGNSYETKIRDGIDRINKKWEVLICCGGGDIYNALYGILSKAITKINLKLVVFHVVVGSFNPNADKLEELAENYSNIRLYYNVKNMAELMKKCDAAVSAAGTVLFELSAMKVPTVFFVCADNQKYDSEFFARNDRMLFAGDIRSQSEECIDAICGQLEKLLSHNDIRENMKIKLSEVTDGNGAKRIAEEIIMMN